MIRRSTWIIVLIFAVSLAVFFWYRQRPVDQPAEPTSTVIPMVISVDPGNFTRITATGIGGRRIAIKRSEDGTWVMTEPLADEIEQSAVATILSNIASLSSINQLEVVPDKEILGLNPPSYVITAELADQSQFILSIGTKTVTGSGYYVQVNNQLVYVISTYKVDDLLRIITDPEYLTPPTPTPESTPVPQATPGD